MLPSGRERHERSRSTLPTGEILNVFCRLLILFRINCFEKFFQVYHHSAGIIFRGDSERFAHFSAKNLIKFGLMGEKSHSKNDM